MGNRGNLKEAIRALFGDNFDEERKSYVSMTNAWKSKHVNPDEEIKFINEVDDNEYRNTPFSSEIVEETEDYWVFEEETDEKRLLAYCKCQHKADASELIYVGSVIGQEEHEYYCPRCESKIMTSRKYDNKGFTNYDILRDDEE